MNINVFKIKVVKIKVSKIKVLKKKVVKIKCFEGKSFQDKSFKNKSFKIKHSAFDKHLTNRWYFFCFVSFCRKIQNAAFAVNSPYVPSYDTWD